MQRALLVVDVQNDFCPGGSLAVPGGDAVVPVLNSYLAEFDRRQQLIYASRDWHPRVTRHFIEGGGVWPAHCVQGTPGAAFHPQLRLPRATVIITKGDQPDADSYSAFDGHDRSGRELAEILHEAEARELYVGGLATDYCVKATVLDGIRYGFTVFLLVDAVAGVERTPGDVQQARKEMTKAGAREKGYSQLRW